MLRLGYTDSGTLYRGENISEAYILQLYHNQSELKKTSLCSWQPDMGKIFQSNKHTALNPSVVLNHHHHIFNADGDSITNHSKKV